MDKHEIGLKGNDVVTSAMKSILGAVPVVGSLLNELVGSVVPNQRIERLEKFAIILDDKLNFFQQNKEKYFKNDECIRLFEEAFQQASKSTSDERRQYIASILENGLKDDQLKYSESRYLMNLLDEMNDIEVIWLRFYLVPTLGGDTEFRNKHKSILDRVVVTLGCGEETQNKGALQQSYIEHLKRLGLIKSHVRRNRDGSPDYDEFTGEPAVSYTDITSLGRLMLRHIGFKETEE